LREVERSLERFKFFCHPEQSEGSAFSSAIYNKKAHMNVKHALNCTSHNLSKLLSTSLNIMAVHSLKQTQFLPISLHEAWDFFSHPKNLAVMTPEYLNLKFTNELYGEEMYPGQVMTYNVRPVLGIPMFWMTEITHVIPKKFFVDEQRFGPYALWHHQHHFEEVEGGVMMTDLIHYKAPLGFLGDLAVALFIKKQLEGIFEFRRKKVEEIF
jgi:ligand-binding SRPBCC domain-containing protein